MRPSHRCAAPSIAWAAAFALIAAACSSGGGGGADAGAISAGGTSDAVGATGTGTDTTGSTGVTGSTGATGSSAVLQSLTVTPASAMVPVGVQQAFTASALFSDGSRQDVTATATWSTSDSSIAAVGTSGIATGSGAGIVTVRASFGGASASGALTVTSATLTALSITPTAITAPAGVSVPLTATALYSDHSSRDVTAQVTWTTGSGAVATVTSTGLLSAVSAGATTVTAAAGVVTKSVPVNVTAATLQSLAVSPGALSLPAGSSDRLTVTGTFSDTTTQEVTAQVAWTSSDAAIATVDETGRVTARAVGSVTISGSLQGRSVSVAVGVTSATLVAVQVTPDLPSVPAGVQVTFTATAIYSDQTTRDLASGVIWTLTDPSVATLSASGIATGLSPGATTVMATVGTVSDSTTLVVTPAVLTAVDVLPPESSIAKGTESFLQATATYSDGSVEDVTAQAFWASDNAAVAVSVDGAGRAVVKGLAVGSANVTATFGDVPPDVATVTVTPAELRSIALTPSSSTIPIGLPQPLVATGTFSDQTTQVVSTEVTWSSSNPAVAAVSTSGVVTGYQAGSTTITATLLGVSSTATVTVTDARLLSIVVEPVSATLPAGYKAQFRATAQYSDGSHDVTSQALWSTSNGAVVTISNASNSKGLATGVAVGTATVKATFGTFSSSASVEVTPERLMAITVSADTFTAAVRTTLQLTATGSFDNGTTLDLTTQCSWKSSAKKTARVSQSGVLTAAKKGTATITATKAGIISDPVTVTVN